MVFLHFFTIGTDFCVFWISWPKFWLSAAVVLAVAWRRLWVVKVGTCVFVCCLVGVRGVLVVVLGLKSEECEKALLAWLKNAVCGRFGGANLARVAFGCGFDKLCFKIILKNALKSLCEIW